jgi:hypothetical protein
LTDKAERARVRRVVVNFMLTCLVLLIELKE